MTPQQETAIIKNCHEGRLDDFALLYDEYIQKIYRFIFYKTRHKEIAEDLTSTTFIKALQNINKFDPDKASFSTWLYRIARNTVIDNHRTKKETVDIENIFDLPASDLGIEDQVDLTAKINDVRKYLEKLQPDQKELVILRVWEGLSYKEIGEIMDKTENASKTMFSRVMVDLRKELGPMAILIIFASSGNIL